jgi:diguanylate cyclase (GGDEF)-like protein
MPEGTTIQKKSKILKTKLAATREKLESQKLATQETERTTKAELEATRKELGMAQEAARIAEESTDIDPLTGLLNTKGFNKAIGREIARSERTGDEIALVFFDLNGLKLVNDTLGHDVGNERIREAAGILSASFRPTDIIARLGDKADEFIAALPMKDVRTIEARYGEVNKNARAANFNWEGYPILLPAGAVKLDKNDVPGSIARADHAMYKAKELSRDLGQNVIRYEPEMTPVT